MLHQIPELLRTVFAFVLVLSVLVFVHELGHYLAARLVGVHVETFSIGFGRALVSWTDRVGTKWKVAWLPLGGYVKLHGQEQPKDVTDEERAKWIPGRTFHDKHVGRRAFVVAAGPLANFALAILLFAALFFAIGRPMALPTIGEVVADGPAARAGLLTGDRILSIDGAPTPHFDDIQRIIAAHPAQALSMQVRRAGGDLAVSVTTDQRLAGGHAIGVLGVRGGEVEYVPQSLLQAAGGGVAQTWEITEQTLLSVVQMIRGQRGTDDLGGPLRIAQLSGEVAGMGAANLLSFIAVLSVNLGLLNLFPIPILDGGHLLFYLAEAVRGRPLPPRALDYGFRAGLALLACVFVFATWNDLSHLGIVRWVAGMFG